MAKVKIHIYAIYFPISDKYYVGQTKNLKRLLGHLRIDFLVGKALQKYDDWQVSILHTCKTRDEANRIEIEEIRHYNCVAPNGYNLTRGGKGTNGAHWNLSEKTKEKMKGNKNAEGLKHSEESKKKMGHPGNQYKKGKKNLAVSKSNKKRRGINSDRYKHGKYTKDAQIKKLKTRIKKLEQDL